MTQAKVRIDPALADLSRSAWEALIYEANLGSETTEIAKQYYIDRKTVYRKLTTARRRVEQVYYDRLKS